MKNAFRIFFFNSWKRELVVVGLMLLTGAVDGVGVASLWPLVGQVSGTGQTTHSMGNAIVVTLNWLGLPLSFEVLLGVIVLVSVLHFVLAATATIFIGRSVAQVATELRLRLINAAVRA